MAVNLPPQYHEAEDRYRKARTPEDKLAALREMWVLLPKHKASEKVQADLKSRISELTDELEQSKQGGKRSGGSVHKLPRQGAGTVVFVGPPNAGKSALLGKLTKATPMVAAYPFTTREPIPGMMDYEDVRVQLVDLPPITPDHYESFITDLTRSAEAALLFVDLSDDDGVSATQGVVERLRQSRRYLVRAKPVEDEDPSAYYLPTLLVGTKADAEAADIRQELVQEAFGEAYPLHVVSVETGQGVEALRGKIYELLGVMRIYTKQPGKPPDLTSPFTCRVGSTVAEFAGCVHRDFEEKVKSARVWGSGVFDGQTVGREHVLHDKDVVELHV